MPKRIKPFVFYAASLVMAASYTFSSGAQGEQNGLINIVRSVFANNMVTLTLPLVHEYYDSSSERLVLVNFKNPIPDGYLDDLELVDIENGHRLEKVAAENLERMLKDAREEGISPVIVSSFRTNKKQETLYQNQIKKQMKKGLEYEKAADAARTVVAYPGTSEHEIGLAVDVVSSKYTGLDKNQEKTPEAIWLMENCVNYGFILRYPSDKTDITEIIYEPWHYRYVGEKAAKEMKENGLCLEEYIEWLKE